LGRAAGGLGVVAATSFYPGKNLGAAGDAGAVTTDDPAIARRVRLLGAHGSESKYRHEIVGFNSRLDTIQTVVLKAKLKRLARWNDLRRAAAARYQDLLADIDGVVVPHSMAGNVDAWHLFVVRVPERDRVLRVLQRAGIGAGIHYPNPVHLTEAFAGLGQGRGRFPVAEQAAGEILSIPLYPHIGIDDQRFVADQLRTAMTTASPRNG